MDAITSLRKQRNISVSRVILVFVLVLFLLGLVATGLLTYHFTPKVHHVKESDCNFTQYLPMTSELVKADELVTEADETTEITTTITSETVTVKQKEPSTRLPRSIVPRTYNIYLLPFIFEGNFTFIGNVSIIVNVQEATRNVILHADELDINHASVEVLKFIEDGYRTTMEIERISNDSKRNFFVINLKSDLQVGQMYEIRMSFVGILNDQLEGFYRSSYVVNNTKRYLK